MAKNERRRTMVYSNVRKNKKADSKSASQKKDKIDLDDEIIIGIASFPKLEEKNKKVSKKEKNKKVTNKKTTKENGGQVNQKNSQKAKKEQDDETKSVKPKAKKIIVNNNIEKKQNPHNQKIQFKKRRIIKRISILSLFIILIIGAVVYLFLSPIFNIKKITVLNNTSIASEQIINISGITTNKNIFKFSKGEVKNKLLANPYIEDVKITRNLFEDEVKIDIKERTATIMLEYGNSYVYINNQGYILEISTEKIDSPIIKGYVTHLEDVKPGNRLCKDDLERLDVVLRILETAESNGIEKLITYIEVKDKKNYVLILESEDKTVYLGNCSDLSTQMLYIKEMVDREKGIEGEFFINMDLNTSNPVFREKV